MNESTLFDTLLARFILFTEAVLLEVDTHSLSKHLKIKKTIQKTNSPEPLLALFKQVKRYHEGGVRQLTSGLAHITPQIKKLRSTIHALSDFQSICEILYTVEDTYLLESFSKEAKKQYPQHLIFSYFNLFAISMRSASPPNRDIDNWLFQLDALIDTSQEQGDKRTTHLAIQLHQDILYKADPTPQLAPWCFEEEDEDGNDEEMPSIAEMAEHFEKTMGPKHTAELIELMNSGAGIDLFPPITPQRAKQKRKKRG